VGKRRNTYAMFARRLRNGTRIWQGLLIIGIVYSIISIATMLMETPYDLDQEFTRPSQPWKQLMWDCKAEGP
jgi:hypothetical protein